MELIKMAAAGNFLRVEELLNGGTVHPDVADKQGHTALIGATVSDILVAYNEARSGTHLKRTLQR